MPVLQISRQPDALAWFDTVRGRPLLAAEQKVIRGALISRPAQQPWLWMPPLAPASAPDETGLPPRSLLLHPRGERYAGTLQCGLPLPLPNESIGNLILQHALDDGREGLLEESARVLAPGGRLWLFVLNPWSPYRARWRSSGLQAHDAQDWRRRLRQLGLQPCGAEVSHLGPLWRMAAGSQVRAPGRLRAVCLLEVEKRTASLIPPAPVARQWRAGAAPA
jgi:SAM-dependent methyltransferase